MPPGLMRTRGSFRLSSVHGKMGQDGWTSQIGGPMPIVGRHCRSDYYGPAVCTAERATS